MIITQVGFYGSDDSNLEYSGLPTNSLLQSSMGPLYF